MALWTDQEWWEANIKDLPAKLFHLGCIGTRNRRPVFSDGTTVDWERVQAVASGADSEYSPPREAPAPVQPPKNKGGRPKGAKDSFKRTRHRK